MVNEYIAYKGEKFIIEWYFFKEGNSQVLEYFNHLTAIEQQKIFYLIKRMGDIGKIFDITKFRNEGDDIYAFKPQPHRFLSFFVKDKKIIITNAFIKKTDKIPKNEKEKALEYKNDYIKRTKDDTYYENNI